MGRGADLLQNLRQASARFLAPVYPGEKIVLINTCFIAQAQLRNVQRRNCCKWKKEPEHCEATLRSYYFCWNRIRRSAILKWCTAIFHNTLFREVAFQWSISLVVVSFTCEISWRTKFQKPRKCSISNLVIQHRSANEFFQEVQASRRRWIARLTRRV